ncbi:MAG: hypothetical protein KDD70_12695 [Bdellovibrionales bacterium]|nr:hypothetical protein [Bdellovibrionales bacterium]
MRSALKTVFVQVFSVSVYTAIVWAFGMESEWPFFFLGAGFMAFIIYRLCQVDGKTTEWRIAAVIVTSFLLSIAAPLKGKYDAGAEERALASKVEAERDFRRERVRAAFISNGNRPLDLGNGKKAYIVQALDYHWRPSGTEVNLWHTTADVRGVSDVWFFAYIDQVYVDMTAPGAGSQSNRYGGSNSGEYTLIWSEGSYTDDGVPRYVVVENLIKGVPADNQALNTALGLDQLPVDAGSTLAGDAAQSNEK